ncbi:MAG TPA: hypothetical protein VD902_05205 [Symbiobacteriaceae bacterium]|nr:hypothetical protein [Symbiobacteriaceae bacterium]
MPKNITEQQAKMLQALQEVKKQKANQPKGWHPDAGKKKGYSGVAVDPHIPQKKP